MNPILKLARCVAMLALTLSTQAKTVRMGIVVGDNLGGPEDARLHYAEEDAQKISDLLQEVGGINPENLILLKSPRPEHVDLAFQQMSAKSRAAAPGDEILFFFYYSGHGTGEALKLGAQAYPLADLKRHIDEVPAKLRIAVLDACQSGAMTRVKGAKVVQPFLLEQDVKSNGSIIITSSSEDENSQESDQLRGSFFTHYWLSALRGAGDVSGDRRVSLLEAYEYAFNKTVVQTRGTRGGAQHPNAQFKLDVEGDVILTDLSEGSGGFVFGNDVQGDFLVANGRAEIMGEFNKDEGKNLFMALPAGDYRVFQKDGRVSRQARLNLANGETRPVARKDLSGGSWLEGVRKGGGSDRDVALPWVVGDWPDQHPWEIGLGFYLTQDYSGSLNPINHSLIADIAYRYYPHCDVAADFTFPSTFHNPQFFEFLDEPVFTQRLSLRLGKFLGPNFEAMGKVFHRSAWRVGDHFGYDSTCTDSTPGCSQGGWRDTKPSWHFLNGSGAELSLRIWLWSRLSVEGSWGVEYNWWQRHVNGIPVRILPSFHF